MALFLLVGRVCDHGVCMEQLEATYWSQWDALYCGQTVVGSRAVDIHSESLQYASDQIYRGSLYILNRDITIKYGTELVDVILP